MALHIPDIREIRLFVIPYADFITNGRMTRILTVIFWQALNGIILYYQEMLVCVGGVISICYFSVDT